MSTTMTTGEGVYTATVAIRQKPERVFDFVRVPENQPRWAINFVLSTKAVSGGKYQMQTPYGPMTYQVNANAKQGTIDFVFDTPQGPNVLPSRVVEHPMGSMFLFTILRAPQMSDAEWAKGKEGLDAELRELRKILEGTP